MYRNCYNQEKHPFLSLKIAQEDGHRQLGRVGSRHWASGRQWPGTKASLEGKTGEDPGESWDGAKRDSLSQLHVPGSVPEARDYG